MHWDALPAVSGFDYATYLQSRQMNACSLFTYSSLLEKATYGGHYAAQLSMSNQTQCKLNDLKSLEESAINKVCQPRYTEYLALVSYHSRLQIQLGARSLQESSPSLQHKYFRCCCACYIHENDLQHF